MRQGIADADAARRTAWLSRGFETLADRVGRRATRLHADDPFDYDVLIVGSGYGGAVALSQLAGRTLGGRALRVCMVERGREYLPGSFPSRFSELAGHVRFSGDQAMKPRGVREGLFDVRIGADLCALLGNGLGGGSLINAGVMAWPHASVFAEARWPKAIRDDRTLKQRAAALRRRLEARPAPTRLAKFDAMRRLAGPLRFGGARITVADRDADNAQGVAMRRCIDCGDCMSGCNHEAKSSLDVTLLVEGRRNGAELYTAATVLRVERLAPGWGVHVVPTDESLRSRIEQPLLVRAARVILAAGAYGSTEILLRSRAAGLPLSSKLGHQFSANGDTVAAVFGSDVDCNAVADEGDAYHARRVGPTITALIDERRGDPEHDLVIQELSVPGPLRRVFEEVVTTADAVHRLAESDHAWYSAFDDHVDPNAVSKQKIAHTLLLALIGRDDASGRLELFGAADPDSGDSAVTVRWPELRNDRRLAAHQRRLAELLRTPTFGTPAFGGRALPNPLWRLLPESVEGVLGEVRGPPLTVHPLGGCPMGDDAAGGVVDHRGGVFDPRGERCHPGLLVLDGAIVPGSLGINPALTIATLAERALALLPVHDWLWLFDPPGTPVTTTAPNALPPSTLPRPRFRTLPKPEPPAPTLLELTERMRGALALALPGSMRTSIDHYRIELTLWFKPVAAAALMAGEDATRRLEVDPTRSVLRILRKKDWPSNEAEPSDIVLSACLCGSLRLLRHAPSVTLLRRARGLLAWFFNRGLRDTAQYLFASLAGDAGGGAGIGQRLLMAWRLASRAGDVRLLEYDLRIGALKHVHPDFAGRLDGFAGAPIRAVKRLTYSLGGNPWQQLGRAWITRFPCGIANPIERDAVEAQLPYFGDIGVPLAHVVSQQDMPSALFDLGSFLLYFVRGLLHLHTWSLRMPGDPPPDEPQRLPGALDRLPPPQVCELAVRRPLPDGTPVLIRLTRYRLPGAPGALPPVLMIHGYSASGTTFAHPAVPSQGLAGHLARQGRDVWVLDLRSSCGLPTALEPWSFEEIGCIDIPKAVDHVLACSGHKRLDIVAHCMGVAMLTLALCDTTLPRDVEDRFKVERAALPARIRRLVMSQVGPDVRVSPGNLLRAYLMRYIRHFLPIGEYRFRPQLPRSAGDALLDRLLSTVPYPRGEFRRENPFWPPGKRTPWVATRHRIDALYGHTFELANMSDAVLARLDDFFGPMNIQTVSQVILFTRYDRITDRRGHADPAKVLKAFDFPMLHLCGALNGLIDPATLGLTSDLLGGGVTTGPARVGLGHQDSLIGMHAEHVFRDIGAFLAQEE